MLHGAKLGPILILMNKAIRTVSRKARIQIVIGSWAVTAVLIGAAVAYQYLDGLLWTLQ